MICLNSQVEVALPQCGHAFCTPCSINTQTGETWQQCPLCSSRYSKNKFNGETEDAYEIVDPMGKDDVIEDLDQNIS